MTTASRALLGDRKFFSWIESIVTVLGSLLLLFLVFISLVSSTFLFEVRDLRCSVQDYKEKANVNSYQFQLKGKKRYIFVGCKGSFLIENMICFNSTESYGSRQTAHIAFVLICFKFEPSAKHK